MTPAPTDMDLYAAGYRVRRASRDDPSHFPRAHVLERPGDRPVLSHDVDVLWSVARAHWRRRELVA